MRPSSEPGCQAMFHNTLGRRVRDCKTSLLPFVRIAHEIYVASCLGISLAAAWLIVHNHRALRQPEQVRRSVWLGFVATILVVATAFVLPSSMPVAVWPFLSSIAGYFYAQRLFGADI